jgi:hypothetical protein
MMKRLKGLVRRHWMVGACRGPSLALRVTRLSTTSKAKCNFKNNGGGRDCFPR